MSKFQSFYTNLRISELFLYLNIMRARNVTFRGVQISRLVDGKVVSKDSILDLLDAIKQLGVIEYTEKGKKLFPENV